MQRSLAASSAECSLLLDKLAGALHDEARIVVPYGTVQDQLVERFKLWGSNLGRVISISLPLTGY